MSIIDEVVSNNRKYASSFKLGRLPMPPARRLAVLACMDARLTLEPMLGVNTGDAHIIRNAGGVATDDALRSLIISCHLLGTREFMVINHTDCGMLTFSDAELEGRLRSSLGPSSVGPTQFHSFKDPSENVRAQIQRIQSHPWIPKDIAVRGFVYDVKTGNLQEVMTPALR